MNRETAQQMIADEIERAMEPLGPASFRLQHQMQQLAARAFELGRQYGLTSLLTVDELAEQFGVTPRRIRARARLMHQRFAVGWQVPGTNQWLFTPEELEVMRPGPPGRPCAAA